MKPQHETRSRFEERDNMQERIANWLAWLLFAALFIVASIAATGCTTTKTRVGRDTIHTNGIIVRDYTETQARTFADSKNKLADFKASQTKTSQTIGIGEQSAESTSAALDQLVIGLQMLGRIVIATPSGAPAAPK